MRRVCVIAIVWSVAFAASAVPAMATVSGDNGVIAFVSDETGVDQIYTIAPDGSARTQLTSFDPTSESGLRIHVVRWSPDGRTIFFGLSGGSSGRYVSGIWLIGADGGDPVFATEGSWPAVAPDASMLAFAKRSVGVVNGIETSVIATLDLVTGVETIVTDPGDWVDFTTSRTLSDWSPIWAPDGGSIYFARHTPGSASISHDSLYGVDLSTGDTEYVARLGGGAGNRQSGYDIAPDGNWAVSTSSSYAVPFGSLTESSLVASDASIWVPLPDSLYAGGPPSYAPAQDGVVVRLYDTRGPTLAVQLWILDDATGWSPLTPGRVPAWQPVNPYPVGLIDPATGEWHLRDAAGKVETFYYGNPGDVPFMGDWDCNGVDTPGLYRQSDGYVYLRNSNTQGIADTKFYFGNPGDIPLAGDFNADGCDTVSIYRPSEQRFYIINELGTNDDGLGAADYSFAFGNPGDKPFTGDFDGNGQDTMGLHRESTGLVYMRNTNTTGIADNQFYFGDPGDRFTAGDWNRDGTDTPTVYRPGNATHYFRFTNTQGDADAQYIWGDPDWLPVTGTYTHN
jgi:hypothetical protein